MNYKAITTLKKADTEGRIPHHTLDQYVRNELAQQLIKALKPTLAIDRPTPETASSGLETPLMVDFTTELFILKPDQWQQVRNSLNASANTLPPDQQRLIRQLIDEIETTHAGLPPFV
ncbi:hypothetical protein [Spirosoma sp.]|uniref:hypothetical protein n=1 Tax=Spirosoma sp. TaxID=1899569 RepID=UPI0026023C2F|nr:hypothetical protein [Spirosoma sp.]MCX6214372.1 hypothetical protein [Spirosoma sp.]